MSEDPVAAELLDRLNDSLPGSLTAGDPDRHGPLRESIEVLGMLPYALAEVEPPPGVRARLLARIEGREPIEGPAAAGAGSVPGSVERGRSWLLPFAASLLIVLLAGAIWRQAGQLEEQRATLAGLAAQMQAREGELAEVAEYQNQLRSLQDQLALVTSRGVEVCTLRPEYAAAIETNARGTLFVASDRQRWYLRIEDLEPCPFGRSYQLWFLKEDGTAVDGGVLPIEHGIELEVSSDFMPASTVAVTITLEPAGGSAAPSGPTVLHGDEVMRIL